MRIFNKSTKSSFSMTSFLKDFKIELKALGHPHDIVRNDPRSFYRACRLYRNRIREIVEQHHDNGSLSKMEDLKRLQRCFLRCFLDRIDDKGVRTIHYAAQWGDVNMVHTLLNLGVIANSQCDKGNSIVHYAALNKNSSVLKYLADKGYRLTVKNNLKNTPMHLACALDNDEALKFLLHRHPEMSEDLNEILETPLHKAIKNKSDVCSELLFNDIIARKGLTQLEKIIALPTQLGYNMMALTILQRNMFALETMLNRGISPLLRSISGRNGLHYAIETLNYQCVQRILKTIEPDYLLNDSIKDNLGVHPLLQAKALTIILQHSEESENIYQLLKTFLCQTDTSQLNLEVHTQHCPICSDKLGDDLILSNCHHCVCGRCFFKNLETSYKCSFCREEIHYRKLPIQATEIFRLIITQNLWEECMEEVEVQRILMGYPPSNKIKEKTQKQHKGKQPLELNEPLSTLNVVVPSQENKNVLENPSASDSQSNTTATGFASSSLQGVSGFSTDKIKQEEKNDFLLKLYLQTLEAMWGIDFYHYYNRQEHVFLGPFEGFDLVFHYNPDRRRLCFEALVIRYMTEYQYDGVSDQETIALILENLLSINFLRYGRMENFQLKVSTSFDQQSNEVSDLCLAGTICLRSKWNPKDVIQHISTFCKLLKLLKLYVDTLITKILEDKNIYSLELLDNLLEDFQVEEGKEVKAADFKNAVYTPKIPALGLHPKEEEFKENTSVDPRISSSSPVFKPNKNKSPSVDYSFFSSCELTQTLSEEQKCKVELEFQKAVEILSQTNKRIKRSDNIIEFFIRSAGGDIKNVFLELKDEKAIISIALYSLDELWEIGKSLFDHIYPNCGKRTTILPHAQLSSQSYQCLSGTTTTTQPIDCGVKYKTLYNLIKNQLLNTSHLTLSYYIDPTDNFLKLSTAVFLDDTKAVSLIKVMNDLLIQTKQQERKLNFNTGRNAEQLPITPLFPLVIDVVDPFFS
jgi:FOG: Ankyrin repeat